MRCDDFESRLFAILDARQDPCRDRTLLQHASECSECQESLSSWQWLAGEIQPVVLPPAKPAIGPAFREQRTHWLQRWNGPLVGVAMAAAWLLAAFWQQPPHQSIPLQSSQIADVAPVSIDLSEFQSRMQQPHWWGSVVVAAWQPVDPLAEGIRPLTDSFQTALELLAPRGARQPSPDPETPDDASAGHFDFYLAIA